MNPPDNNESDHSVEADKLVPDTSAPENNEALSPVDDLVAVAMLKFYLTEGREYENHLVIPVSKVAEVKQNMTAALENQAPNVVLTLEGSDGSPYDFTAIPMKHVIYFKLSVVEIRKK